MVIAALWARMLEVPLLEEVDPADHHSCEMPDAVEIGDAGA